MKPKIILAVADYINAYESYKGRMVNDHDMNTLTDLYNSILENAQNYAEDYEKFMLECEKENLFTLFQKTTAKLQKKITN